MEQHMKAYIDYSKKTGQRDTLYQTVASFYNIKTAIYPGSHIDIAPSLYIPEVKYIDSFKGAIKFFSKLGEIKQYITQHKHYNQDVKIIFFGESYDEELDIDPVDLIISQYAGFVSQATKKYLRPGGILLANDSHGDATLAYLDKDFQLVGVMDNYHQIQENNLDQYFQFARKRDIDKAKVLKTMKGPKYKLMANNYLFKYIDKQ